MWKNIFTIPGYIYISSCYSIHHKRLLIFISFANIPICYRLAKFNQVVHLTQSASTPIETPRQWVLLIHPFYSRIHLSVIVNGHNVINPPWIARYLLLKVKRKERKTNGWSGDKCEISVWTNSTLSSNLGNLVIKPAITLWFFLSVYYYPNNLYVLYFFESYLFMQFLICSVFMCVVRVNHGYGKAVCNLVS